MNPGFILKHISVKTYLVYTLSVFIFLMTFLFLYPFLTKQNVQLSSLTKFHQ